MRIATLLLLYLVCGCGYVVEPGHRGLLFNPRRAGLEQHVLGPGWHRVGVFGRVDDFDVTYSTKHEDLHTISVEGLSMDVRVCLIFRPIVSELYDLDVEIGPNYYEEVVGPEFRTATRGVFARHSYLEVQKINEKLEDEIEAELRRRITGKHIETVMRAVLLVARRFPAFAAAANLVTVVDSKIHNEPITTLAIDAFGNLYVNADYIEGKKPEGEIVPASALFQKSPLPASRRNG